MPVRFSAAGCQGVVSYALSQLTQGVGATPAHWHVFGHQAQASLICTRPLHSFDESSRYRRPRS